MIDTNTYCLKKTPIYIYFIIGVFLFSCNRQSGDFSIQKDSFVFPDFSENDIDSIDIRTDDAGQLDLLLKVLDRFEKDSIHDLAAISARKISRAFRFSGFNENATIYAKKGLYQAQLSGDSLLIMKLHLNLGKTYMSQINSFDENRSTDEERDELEKYIDSAKVSVSSSLEISKYLSPKYLTFSEPKLKVKEYYDLTGSAYSNLSVIYFTQGDFFNSRIFANKALVAFNHSDSYELKIAPLNTLGNISISLKDFGKAAQFYEQALAIINESEGSQKIDKINLLINYAWTLRQINDITAFDFLEEAYTLEFELNEEKMQTKLAELEKKHNVETVRKEEAVLKQQEIDKTNDFKIFSGLLLLLTIILSGTIFTLYRGSQLKQKNLELQLDKEQLLKSAELERLEKLSQTKVLNATMDGRESERKLIAEILHDSVSSLLSSANLHLQASRSVYHEETPEEIEKSQRIIVEASEKIRNLSHELISSVLLKFGLSYSIFDLCEKYSNSQLEIVHDVNNVRRYDQSFEIKINNIIEELVNNILKHSKATEAIISLEQRGEELLLEITDNGEGFDYRGEPNTSGLGLNQIKARILMMKGKINIDSIPTQGTTINIVVPVVKREVRKSELA